MVRGRGGGDAPAAGSAGVDSGNGGISPKRPRREQKAAGFPRRGCAPANAGAIAGAPRRSPQRRRHNLVSSSSSPPEEEEEEEEQERNVVPSIHRTDVVDVASDSTSPQRDRDVVCLSPNAENSGTASSPAGMGSAVPLFRRTPTRRQQQQAQAQSPTPPPPPPSSSFSSARPQPRDELDELDIDPALKESLREMDAATRREVLNDILRNRIVQRSGAGATGRPSDWTEAPPPRTAARRQNSSSSNRGSSGGGSGRSGTSDTELDDEGASRRRGRGSTAGARFRADRGDNDDELRPAHRRMNTNTRRTPVAQQQQQQRRRRRPSPPLPHERGEPDLGGAHGELGFVLHALAQLMGIGGTRGGEGAAGVEGGDAAGMAMLNPMLMELNELHAMRALGIDGDVDEMDYEQLLALQERVGHVSRGITPAQVAQVTDSVPLSPTKARYDSSNNKCCICQCEFESGEGRGLALKRCGHVYHDECIRQWFAEHRTCPICTTEVL